MTSPFKNIQWHTYLLQLENYHHSRFIGKAMRDWRAPDVFRKEIVWTKKLVGVVSLAILLVLAVTVLLATSLFPAGVVRVIFAVALLFLFSYAFFLPLLVVVIVLRPLDEFVKRSIVRRAQKKIRSLSNLKVVAITGSYGKTTMRHVVSNVLEEGKKVVATKENFNTPLGISRQILSELSPDTEVYVVEMGAYTRRDIAYLCSITQPDVAILTGINEAHLERQGSVENIIKTKFEIVEHAKDDALVVLNGDDERVRSNASVYIKSSQQVAWSGADTSDVWAKVINVKLDTDKPGVHFTLEHGGSTEKYETRFLARYIVGVVMSARIVADHFGIPSVLVRQKLSRLAPVEHRLSASKTANGVLVIDDAYNGNPDGVREALDVLKEFEGRRRIVVTPGLVEMGDRMEDVHREIAHELKASAEIVVLVDTPASRVIREALQEMAFENVSLHERAEDAHEYVRRMLKEGDVVLFQNDVAENYQ